MPRSNDVGQSFNAGDILLEIETDKAQMDVEAQDDGILAKIVVPGGSKNVKVGKMIAMLAEQGDDLSAIVVPNEEDVGEPPTNNVEIKTKTNDGQTSSKDSSREMSIENVHISGFYPPAVLRLLQEFRIEDPSVITPTGPQGRILKGDVLAHIGRIGKQVPQTLNEILSKKRKLDLTNIQAQKPQATPVASPSLSGPKLPSGPSKLMTVVRVRDLQRIQRKISGAILRL
jgi:pyruvate/2-oxoglutarate dehydrogenase complex dihydrolipoamide acyltransferase (E2) component